MATPVQSNVGTLQGTGPTLAVSYNTANANGNLLVAKIWLGGSGNSLSSFTDSQGNTWVQQRADLAPSGINLNFYSYYCLSAKPGANTVTVVFSANVFAGMYITEASGGSGATWSTDGTTFTVGGPSTAVDSGPITTTGTNEFLVSQVNMASANPVTPGSGWTTEQTDVFGNTMQAQAPTSAGTFDSTATLTSSTTWYCDITAFKATGGGAGPVTPVLTGNVTVTGTEGVQIAFEPVLSGVISVTGSVNPTITSGGGPVSPGLSGSIGVSGAVFPTIFNPNVTVALTGTIGVTGQVNPILSGQVRVAVSGVVGVTGSVFPIVISPTPPPPASAFAFIGLMCPTTPVYAPVVQPGQRKPEDGPRAVPPGCAPGLPTIDFSGGPWQT